MAERVSSDVQVCFGCFTRKAYNSGRPSNNTGDVKNRNGNVTTGPIQEAAAQEVDNNTGKITNRDGTVNTSGITRST